MERSLRRFWGRNFTSGEARERGIGRVEVKSTSLIDGDINPQCLIEIRAKPVQLKESIGACFGERTSPTHISGIAHGESVLQKQVCLPKGYPVCKSSSCPRSRNGGCRRDLLAVAGRCSLMEHLERRNRSIARARLQERICCPEQPC